jgi:hypothetical protein
MNFWIRSRNATIKQINNRDITPKSLVLFVYLAKLTNSGYTVLPESLPKVLFVHLGGLGSEAPQLLWLFTLFIWGLPVIVMTIRMCNSLNTFWSSLSHGPELYFMSTQGQHVVVSLVAWLTLGPRANIPAKHLNSLHKVSCYQIEQYNHVLASLPQQ